MGRGDSAALPLKQDKGCVGVGFLRIMSSLTPLG